MFNVIWSDKLENLADSLFDKLDLFPLSSPLHQECIVINSPVLGAWLKQYFLYERRGKGRQRVLANWDVQYLYPFINDWLFRMTHAVREQRNAEYHPYSKDCLQWRIYQLLPILDKTDAVYKPLFHYIGIEQDESMPLPRCYSLAGVLARMYDDYQVYRPEMLYGWQNGDSNLSDTQLWQQALWQELDSQDYRSYLQDFIDIKSKLPNSEIREQYERISIFGVSSMPPVYLHFFQNLPEELDVDLYIFNPSCKDWYEDTSVKENDKRIRRNNIQGGDTPDEYMDVGNPLLSSLGKSSQEYLAEIIDRSEGNIFDLFSSEPDISILKIIQNDIKMRRACNDGGRKKNILTATEIANDESIQIQICHSPMREVEVLHDYIMKWFLEDEKLQPHDIQVLVTDIDKYIPYINALFTTGNKDSHHYIPHTIAESGSFDNNKVAALFIKLLSLPQNRFKASEVVDILSADIIAGTFDLESSEVDRIKSWIVESGIRWGIDEDHREEVTGCEFESFTSWQRGLDRMMFGYAIGRVDSEASCFGVIDGATFGKMLPYDEIEGGATDYLGKLMNYFIKLRSLHNRLTIPRVAAEWKVCLTDILDNFFISDNDSYRDIASIKSAIDSFAETVNIAGGEQIISREIVVSFMEQHLVSNSLPCNTNHNGVVFSSLRFMRSTPRKIICLLGMNDGSFPRADRRPCFDLLREKRKRCDRSQRLDDRNAFLEALMSARERFYISYIGRAQNENNIIPPSILVSELLNYMQDMFELPAKHITDDKQELQYCETLHRLQAFNVKYFVDNNDNLFSFSRTNKIVAQTLLTRLQHGEKEQHKLGNISSENICEGEIELDALIRFLRNPSEYFYKNILQTRFNISISESLADTEKFDTNALDKYLIRNEIMDVQLMGGSKSSDKYNIEIAFKEKGILPLDIDGHEKFEELWNETTGFLDKNIVFNDELYVLRDILADTVEEKQVLFAYKDIVLNGMLDIRKIAGCRVLVMYRYAAINSKYLLRAWISHLLFSQIEENPYTLVVGRKKQILFSSNPTEDMKISDVKWMPELFLQNLLDLYQEGQSRILPFIPETSYAFVTKSKGAAMDSWVGGFCGNGDSSDPYFLRAFGENGPMDMDEFDKLAKDIFNPLLIYKKEN